jgi:vacuolar-type H+-ATPase subunit H
LTDQTPELIKWIQEILDNKLEEFKEEANKKLELTKKETEKVLWNLEYEIKTLKEKIDKLSKT